MSCNMEIFDGLDKLAEREDLEEVIGLLSSGERIYVALAANRTDLLTDHIVYSMHRLGTAWLQVLIERHKYD